MTGDSSSAYLELGRLGESSWWRYLIGAFMVATAYIIAGVFWYVVILVLASRGHMPAFDKVTGQPLGIEPMANYVAINIPAIFLWSFTYLAVRFLLRRPFLSLITTASSFDWKRVGFGFVAGFSLASVAGLIGWLIFPNSYKFVMPDMQYFAWIPLIFLMTPVQCAAEELFFRGYLLQGFGRAIKNIWLASAVNGFLFMLPHMWNPEVSYGALPMALCYFSVGFLLAILALRTNGLEISIGVHIANNLFDCLIVNDVRSVLTTRSLVVCTQGHPWYETLALIALGAVLVLIVWRRYPSGRRPDSVISAPTS
jgi:membrane protease YdiL (CAAX protease family)